MYNKGYSIISVYFVSAQMIQAIKSRRIYGYMEVLKDNQGKTYAYFKMGRHIMKWEV